MKIIYERTMLEKIRSAKREADHAGKRISSVELSVSEARALWNEPSPAGRFCVSTSLTPGRCFGDWLLEVEQTGRATTPQPEIRVFGIRIDVLL